MIKVLCLDPSGEFTRGEGTTGWAIFIDGKLKEFGDVKANDYSTDMDYWSAVLDLLDRVDLLVCESFKLFAHKAMQQSWSNLETSQLIGALRLKCRQLGIPIILQDPACKTRVADPILEYMGVIEKRRRQYYCMGKPTNLHMRDAIRHGIYYHRYRKE